MNLPGQIAGTPAAVAEDHDIGIQAGVVVQASAHAVLFPGVAPTDHFCTFVHNGRSSGDDIMRLTSP
jgi:hypothetical protein